MKKWKSGVVVVESVEVVERVVVVEGGRRQLDWRGRFISSNI